MQRYCKRVQKCELLSEIQKEREQGKCQQNEEEQASEQAYSQVWQQVEEQGIRAEKLEQELHEAKTHLNSLELPLQAAEPTSVTGQSQMMAVENEREQLQKDLAELEKMLVERKLELDKQSQRSSEELQLLLTRHRMRELWIYQILEEEAGFWECMRELWVYQIMEEDAGIDPAASRKKSCGRSSCGWPGSLASPY